VTHSERDHTGFGARGGSFGGGGGYGDRERGDRYAFSGGGYQEPLSRGGGDYEVRRAGAALCRVCPLMRVSARAPAARRAARAQGLHG
jgi:hypothetical protein